MAPGRPDLLAWCLRARPEGLGLGPRVVDELTQGALLEAWGRAAATGSFAVLDWLAERLCHRVRFMPAQMTASDWRAARCTAERKWPCDMDPVRLHAAFDAFNGRNV